MADSPAPEKRRRIDRVIAACDLCKKRKVKCDGLRPCDYCMRKDRASFCTYSAANSRGISAQAWSTCATPKAIDGEERGSNETPIVLRERTGGEAVARQELGDDDDDDGLHQEPPTSSLSPTVSRDDHHEDTAVPLEGSILRDAQGKAIFIGDCAPLSFLQTVRYLITSEVDAEGFTVQTSRDSLIEIARPNLLNQSRAIPIPSYDVSNLVDAYAVATAGLVDLFHHEELHKEVRMWTRDQSNHADDAAAAVFYLVLAIGAQEAREVSAEGWSDHARDLLLRNMCSSMNVATVQGFALLAIFMLRAFQPNGAYLYFSLAARTAYAIGIHRTEVNASFGDSIKTRRDRVWKSLRVVDMLISSILGRPPSTSDVDCTVKYQTIEMVSYTPSSILDASVQIFMIIERVVVEVYSRKRISLRIAAYVSRQLKNWATNWLRKLTELTELADPKAGGGQTRATVVGACSTLCSYYYGIMLLARPFLIYEIYEHLGANLRGSGSQSDHRDKRRYADAALDAAASFVETLQMVIQSGTMPQKMPLIVPWLFTTALVLAVGILGNSGLTFVENCTASIRCLDYFGRSDPHARQYSVIVQSLLKITTSHVQRRENDLRSRRKQASSDLFGMLPCVPGVRPDRSETCSSAGAITPQPTGIAQPTASGNPETSAGLDWTIYDADFFALPWSNETDQGLQDFLQPGTINLNGGTVADIPLFPMYNQHSGPGFAG